MECSEFTQSDSSEWLGQYSLISKCFYFDHRTISSVSISRIHVRRQLRRHIVYTNMTHQVECSYDRNPRNMHEMENRYRL